MNFFKGKKILVTGGMGMIGSALARELVKRGADVSIVDNASRGSLDNIKDFRDGVDQYIFDLTDAKNIKPCFRDQDMVVMLAAKIGSVDDMIRHPSDFAEENMRIDINTMKAVKENHIKHVVFASSASVYGKKCKTPYREDDPNIGLGFESIYGESKYYMENYIKSYRKQYGIRSTILRFFNVYSEYDPFSLSSHCIPALCYKAIVLKQSPFEVWGSGEQSRSFVHTSDIVEGTLLGMERAPDGVPINLGTPERVKIKDLARKILRYSGHSPAKIWFNTDRPEGMSDRPADNSRARELIGWEPKLTFDEGLKRTVDGFKKRIRDGDYEKPVT